MHRGRRVDTLRLLAITSLLTLGCALATEAAGVIRYMGPVKSCKVAWTDSVSGASIEEGQLDLHGNLQVPARQQVLKVTLTPGAEQPQLCSDSFSNASITFPLQAIIPPPEGAWASNTLTVNAATTAVAAYLDTKSSAGISWIDIDASLFKLYGLLGADVSVSLPSSSPPSTLQSLDLAKSGDSVTRGMGVALMAAESQLSTYLALGTCLLTSSAAGFEAAAAVRSLSQQLLAAAAQPGYASVLTSKQWVFAALVASASSVASVNVTALTPSMNSTAQVIVSLANVAEPFRAAAVQLMGGVQPAGGLDVLAAAFALAQVPSVQRQACSAIQGNMDVSSFLPPNLPIALDAAPRNYHVILSALGLAWSSASQSTAGAATAIGPLVKCSGESDSFLSSGGSSGGSSFSTDAFGRYSINPFYLGRVSVDPRAGCLDAMTNLELELTLTSFSVPVPVLALSPITILAEGFYRLLSSQALVLPPDTLQASAFSAVGLNVQQVLAALPPSGSAVSSTYVAKPIMVATAAASVQVMSLLYSAMVLFMPSAIALQQSTYRAESLVVSSTAYAVAKKATSSGGLVNLADASVVYSILLQVKQLCSVNSSHLPPDTDWLNVSPPISPPPSPPKPPPRPPPSPKPLSRSRRQALGAGDTLRQSSELSAQKQLFQPRPLDRPLHSPSLGLWTGQGSVFMPRPLPTSGSGSRRRGLLIYTDQADFDRTVKVLSSIVSTVASVLEPLKQAALTATATATTGATSSSPTPPSPASSSGLPFNATAALLQISRIMVVVQASYLPQAVSSLQASSFGLASLSSLQDRYGKASSYNTSALSQVPVNVDYVCNATQDCASSAPPPPPSDASSPSSSLALAVGLTLGIGLPVLLLLAFLIYRCCSERVLAQSVRSKHTYADQAAVQQQQQQQQQMQMQQYASPLYSKSAAAAADAGTMGRASYRPSDADAQQQLQQQAPYPMYGNASMRAPMQASRFSQPSVSAAAQVQQQPWATSPGPGQGSSPSYPAYSQAYYSPSRHASAPGVSLAQQAASQSYQAQSFDPDASLNRTFRQGIVGSLYTGVPTQARVSGNGSSLNSSMTGVMMRENPSFRSNGAADPVQNLGVTYPPRMLPVSQQGLNEALQGSYGTWQGGSGGGAANQTPGFHSGASWTIHSSSPPRQG